MDLRYYIHLLRQRLWLVVALVGCAIAAAVVFTPRTPVYTAQATLFIGTQNSTSTSGATAVSNDLLAAFQRLAVTFAAMIDSRPIATKALEATKAPRTVDQLLANSTATPVTDTQLIRVAVKDRDPRVAQRLANAESDAFVQNVQTFVAPSQDQAGQTQLPARIFESAPLPTTPEPSGLGFKVGVAILIALSVSIGLIVVIDYLDVTVRAPVDAEHRLGLPVLGAIPMELPGNV